MGVAKENFILKMVQTQRSCSVCMCSSCGQLFTAGSRTASRSELAQTAGTNLCQPWKLHCSIWSFSGSCSCWLEEKELDLQLSF